jgi:hypothetical protein
VKNFNEGTDQLLNSGLDGLAVAGKLWAWLCSSHAEADVTPANVKADLTKVGTAVAVVGRSSVARIIDLGILDFSTSNVGSAKSVVVSTDDPANVGAKLLVIQDLNGGAAINLATSNGVVVDDLSIALDYLVSGSVN